EVGVRRHIAAASLLRDPVEQEICEREAREGAGVVEVAEDSFVARVREALLLVEPAATELQLMTALEYRELLGELIALDVVELRDPRVAEAHVADVEVAQAGDALAAGNADGRLGVADAGPVHGNGLELHVREAPEQLVDGVRAQGARPVVREAQEGRIVSARQLALKRASFRLRLVLLVRDATKHPVVAREIRV